MAAPESNSPSPDEIFDQQWARSIMKAVLQKLGAEYHERGKSVLFDRFKDLQPGEHGAQSHVEIAAALGMTEQAVKNARHTFNRRYAELLRQEVAQTISDPAELEAEMQHLLHVFSS